MSSADAPSAAVRTMTPPFFGAIALRMSRRRMRSSSSSRRETPRPSPLGTKTTKRPGSEISVVSRAPFDFIGSLTAWTRISWSALDQVLDLAAAAALELGADDLVDVQEAVLLEADLDERGLHAGEDVVDGALVDVAGDRAALGALEVDLGGPAVLEDGDALLADVDRDEELALRGRERRAARRRTRRRWLLRWERWLWLRWAGLRSGFFSAALGSSLSRPRSPRPSRQACAGCARREIRVAASWSMWIVRPPRRASGLLQVVRVEVVQFHWAPSPGAACAETASANEISFCGARADDTRRAVRAQRV